MSGPDLSNIEVLDDGPDLSNVEVLDGGPDLSNIEVLGPKEESAPAQTFLRKWGLGTLRATGEKLKGLAELPSKLLVPSLRDEGYEVPGGGRVIPEAELPPEQRSAFADTRTLERDIPNRDYVNPEGFMGKYIPGWPTAGGGTGTYQPPTDKRGLLERLGAGLTSEDETMLSALIPTGTFSNMKAQPAPLISDPAMELSGKIGGMAAKASPLPLSLKSMREEFPKETLPTGGQEAASSLFGFILTAHGMGKLIKNVPTALAGTTFIRDMSEKLSDGKPFGEAYDESMIDAMSDMVLFGGGSAVFKGMKRLSGAGKAKIPTSPTSFANLPPEIQTVVESRITKEVNAFKEPALAYKGPKPNVEVISSEKPAIERFTREVRARPKGEVEPVRRGLQLPGAGETYRKPYEIGIEGERVGKTPALEDIKPVTPSEVPQKSPYEVGVEGGRVGKTPAMEDIKPVVPSEPRPTEIQRLIEKKKYPAAVAIGVGGGAASESDNKNVKTAALIATAPLVIGAAIRSPAARKLMTSPAGRELVQAVKDSVSWIREARSGRSVTKTMAMGYEPSATRGKFTSFLARNLGKKYANFPKGEVPNGLHDLEKEYDGVGHMATRFHEDAYKIQDPQKLKLLEEVVSARKSGIEPEYYQHSSDKNFKKALDSALDYRARNTELQDELVRLGRLDPKTALLYRSQYGSTHIKDIYDIHQTGKGPVSFQKARVAVKQIIERDKDIPESWKEEHRIDWRDRAYESIMEDSGRVYSARVIDLVKGDPSITLSGNNLSLAEAKYGKDLSKLSEITIKPEGFSRELRYVKISGTAPEILPVGKRAWIAETFGKSGLQGKFVLEDVAGMIDSTADAPGRWYRIFNDFMSQHPAMQKYSALRSAWKVEKAVTNTANLIANPTWNSFSVEMATGINPLTPEGFKRYSESIKNLMGRTENFKLAEKYGLFGRGGINREMSEGYRMLSGAKSSEDFFAKLQKVTNSIGNVYGFQENIAKTFLFDYAIKDLGFDPKAAVRFAEKHLYDYGDVSKAISLMRRVPFGAPFVTFFSKATPRAFEYILNSMGSGKAAVRFWKYPAMFMGWQEYAIQKNKITDQELKEARNALAPWQKLSIVVGRDEKTKKPLFLGLQNFFPFAELMGLGGQNLTEVVGGFFGGPELGLVRLLNGKTSFGSTLVRPEDTTFEAKFGRYAEEAGKILSPQVMVHLWNIGKAMYGSKDYSGREKELWKEVAKMFAIYLYTPTERDVMWSKNQPLFKVREAIKRIQRSQENFDKQERIEAALKEMDETIKDMDKDTLDIIVRRIVKSRNLPEEEN